MKNGKGFTLIELLVVIAIISLLLSIVLPSLRAVKEQAKKAVCQSHMKQVGTLILTYATEHDDQLISTLKGTIFSGLTGTEYYGYYHAGHPVDVQGPSGLGWLYTNQLLESGSDIPFCPSMQNLFGSNMPTKEWNPNGNKSHWNYCGEGGTYTLNPKDKGIGWLPLRLTIGTRALRLHGDRPGWPSRFKTIADASVRGKRAFLSDLWAASGTSTGTWHSRETDIPHRSGGRMSLNAWYFDGHVDNVRMQDEWFEERDGIKYLKTNITWSEMFD